MATKVVHRTGADGQYQTSATECTCPARKWKPYQDCKHMKEVQDMTQAHQPTDLAVRSAPVTGLPDLGEVEAQLTTINRFQEAVHRLLREGSDYGVIPGTGSKPCLLKPGAEKITKLLGAEARFQIVPTIDWQQHPPFFAYDVTCEIYQVGTDVRLATGVGSCNSWESKYRYRRQERTCPACDGEYIIKGRQEYGGGWLCYRAKGGCGAKYDDGDPAIESQPQGRVINEDTADQANTILKIAKKRAHIDASLGFAVLSDAFTQDLEDMPQQSRPQTQSGPEAQQPQVFGHCYHHGEDLTRKTQGGMAIHRAGDDHFCNGTTVFDREGMVVVDLEAEAMDLGADSEPDAEAETAEPPTTDPRDEREDLEDQINELYH